MLISLTLPRTWRTTKCLGSGILLKHMLSWTWLTIKSKCLEFDIFVRSTLPYFLEHVKGRWSFPQTFQEGVCILMGMLGAWHIVKLSVPETWPKASRFGWRQIQHFGTWHTAKTNHGWVWLAPDSAFPRAWHTIKPNHVCVWLALDPACPGLDTLPNLHSRHMLLPLTMSNEKRS